MSDLICQCAIITNNIQLKQQLGEVNKMGGFYHSSKQYATVTAQKLIQREITHVLFCMSLCHSLKQYATKTTSGKG